ncbi:hypothetical protein [Vallitalea sp.]|jgi:hypothetical protein|uniref:hypothetical protein n=1 Tax=Vallitalea sp. TaxID=1882829 RepID=UPI0025F6B128|nr:hypothetical protein [Vallitalea sp.]MCT4688157.1 hypothetical protein [Vallitalea sp.]
MEQKQFTKFFENYKHADVDRKIELYCSTQGLSENQYMQLLRAFPVNKIPKLEKALS